MCIRLALRVDSQYPTSTLRTSDQFLRTISKRRRRSFWRGTRKRVWTGEFATRCSGQRANTDTFYHRYWAYKSAYSMDGLPAMRRGLAVGKQFDVAPLKKMVGPLAPKVNGIRGGPDGFTLEHLVVVFITAFIAGLMIMFAVYPKIEEFIAPQSRTRTGPSWSIRSLR